MINNQGIFKLKCGFEFPTIPLDNLQEKEIEPTIEKQDIVADENYDALSKVIVNAVTNEIDSNIQANNIRQGVTILGVEGNIYALVGETKTIEPKTTTQIYTPSEGKNGFTSVTVDKIPDEYIIPSGDINITSNGTYDVTEKASAIVNVPEPTGTLDITSNGNYNVKEKEFANVNVPEKVLGTKTITENGIYKATDDNLDGYSEVEVATSGVDINDYFGDTITSGEASIGGWTKIIKKIRSPLTISGTSAYYMFGHFIGTEIPRIDTQNVTSMSGMFSSCTNLTTIPELNTQNVNNMSGMFQNCSSLTTIPQLNTSAVTNMSYMFSGCTNLTTIPELNTQNVTSMSGMFINCKKIITLPKLNAAKVIDIYRFMLQSPLIGIMPLENFGGLENLGQAYLTTQSANYYSYTFDLSDYKKLTHDSLMNVINGLYDIASAGVKPQQLVLGSTNLAKLSDEEKAICTTKGWNLS